ncbi:isopenicillin N synthetase, putative, partial [Perkinsus marinus ATCC 50983]
FFNLPSTVKREVLATAEDFEGYDAGGELLYRSEETDEYLQQTRGQADAKESYQIWPSTSSYPGSTRSGPSKWPRLPPGFRDKYMAYYREMERLTSLIYKVLAIALGKDPCFFNDMNHNHLAVLRLLCYKEEPTVPQGGVRCSVHSDWGPLTLLRQANSDACGMYLQIVGPSNDWIDVKTSGDEILVNTGDMMDYWTNHRWRAIKHRVIQPEGPLVEPRYSFAYFHSFNADSMADPHDFDADALSRPVNQWEYVVQKKTNSIVGDAY